MYLNVVSVPLFASDEQAKQISALTSSTVYNLDTEELPNILSAFLNRNDNIEALIITDFLSKDILFQFYRNNKAHVYNQPIPEDIMKLQVSVASILYQNEQIGSVIIYYREQKKTDTKIQFSQEEQAWLAQKIPVRYVFDPDWKPFESKNEVGKHVGVLADILTLVKQKSGLNLVSVPTDNWSEAIQYVKEKKADMFSGIGVSNERKGYLDFTVRNIFSVPYVVIGNSRSHTKGEIKEPISIADLSAHKIGMVKDYAIYGMVQEKAPNQSILVSDSINEGLESLLDGHIDYFILNNVTAKTYLYQSRFNNLYKVGLLDGFNLDLKIALRKDWQPILLSILDKTLLSIPDEKITKIYQKWAPKPSDYSQDNIKNNNKMSLTVQVTGGFIAVVALVLFILWLVKGRPKQLSIKHTLILIFFVLIAMVLTTAVLVTMLLKSQSLLQTVQEKNLNSLNLVQELKHSSDGLTRFSRLYVLTQNKTYKQYFQQILDVRNGVIPHYKNDFFSYWDEAFVYAPKHDQKGETYNIQEKMASLGFTQTENKLLTQSHLASDLLAKIERQAMNMVEGYYLDDKGNYSVQGIPNLERAKSLLFNQVYHEQKQSIMQPLSELKSLLMIRFKAHVNDVVMQNNAILTTIAVFVLMMVLFTVYAYLLLSRRIIKPLELFVSSTKKIQQGDYSQKVQLSSQDEMRQLADSFNDMCEGIASRTKEIKNSYHFTQALLDSEEKAKLELHRLHKHTRDSIEYAALIQQAIIPEESLFSHCFSDHFTMWRPKDVVGGDIYLFSTLRHKDEYLLMVIDCAGHGVPGAFVTMLVKAIEREVEALIVADPNMNVSPAWILSYFNKSMKSLLKQHHVDSISNAGFDGGIVYYNKKDQIIKFSGAETSLFCIGVGEDPNELNVIKGNRHSVGYKNSCNDYLFTEHVISVKQGMQFYLPTDGYFDQNGGKKGFPYGKKRFGKQLLECAEQTFEQQEAFLIKSVQAYQGNEEQSDDICIIGFKI